MWICKTCQRVPVREAVSTGPLSGPRRHYHKGHEPGAPGLICHQAAEDTHPDLPPS
jgi:hypothetical protein